MSKVGFQGTECTSCITLRRQRLPDGLKDIRPEGTSLALEPDLHTSCFAVTLGPPQGDHAPHTHRFHELYLNTGGAGHQWTDRQAFAMKQGELFFFPAGQPHTAAATPRAKTSRGIVLNFAESIFTGEAAGLRDATTILRHLTDECWAGRNRITPSGDGRRRVRNLLLRMQEENQQKGAGFRCLLAALLCELLVTLLRDPALAPRLGIALTPAPTQARMAEVLRFIHRRYMEPIPVEKAAAMACLSRSHFHALFRQETGFGLTEYVNLIRVERSVELLRGSSLPIAQVAAQCGFPSLSHFYHCFSDQIGCTPAQMRRKSRR